MASVGYKRHFNLTCIATCIHRISLDISFTLALCNIKDILLLMHLPKYYKIKGHGLVLKIQYSTGFLAGFEEMYVHIGIVNRPNKEILFDNDNLILYCKMAENYPIYIG